jgi:hypothetical protein
MRLPSKVTSFTDSTLSILPLLLNEITKGDIVSMTLFRKVENKVDGISNFLIALDCLFALNKIKLIEQTGVISYVD